MIYVESITIKEFRGIRDLSLTFGATSYGICGPNGTGKSGVVDALEFDLTGNVSRLSGEGKGEVSLKAHGPHVDRRSNPDKARVTVNARKHFDLSHAHVQMARELGMNPKKFGKLDNHHQYP